MQLENKTCIITGGGRGIGKAIALAFAREGANLVLASRTRPELEATKKGIMDSSEHFSLINGVGEAIKKLRENDYKVILVSNQPGIAKGLLSRDIFIKIRKRMNRILAVSETRLDGEYYCLHHPEAVNPRLRTNCECRKPKPGLLLQASREMDIDLAQSWMVGDGITDIQAGKRASCRTILIGRMKCEFAT